MTTDPLDLESSLEASDTPQAAGLVDSLIRLGVGGLFVGAHAVRRPATLLAELAPGARADEAAAGASGGEDRFDGALNVAVGAAETGRQAVARGVAAAMNVNRRAWRVTAPLRKPLQWVGVNRLVENAAQSAAVQVDRWQQVGRVEVLEGRQQALGALTTTIDAVVAYLGQSPAVTALIRDKVQQLLPELAHDPGIQELVNVQVETLLPQLAESAAIQALIEAQLTALLPSLAHDEGIQALIQAQVDGLLPQLSDSPAIQSLIRTQASAYLFYLQSHPDQIEALIRKQGNTYIDYLNENPEKVRNLVSGQGMGLAGEMLDQVRERTVTADSVAEMVMRGLLRKRPRSEVDQPSEAVQRRALAATLPSDFVRPQENDDGR